MVNITCVSKRLLDLRRDSNSSGMQWVRANARRLSLEKKINTEKTLYSISNFSLSMRQHNFSTGNYQSIVSKLNHFQSGDVQRVLFSFSSLNVCLVPINNTYLALRSLYSSHSPRTLIHEKRYSFKKIYSDVYSPQKKS